MALRGLSQCTRSNGRCRPRDLFLTRNETLAFAPPDFLRGKLRRRFAKFSQRLKNRCSLTPTRTGLLFRKPDTSSRRQKAIARERTYIRYTTTWTCRDCGRDRARDGRRYSIVRHRPGIELRQPGCRSWKSRLRGERRAPRF